MPPFPDHYCADFVSKLHHQHNMAPVSMVIWLYISILGGSRGALSMVYTVFCSGQSVRVHHNTADVFFRPDKQKT